LRSAAWCDDTALLPSTSPQSFARPIVSGSAWVTCCGSPVDGSIQLRTTVFTERAETIALPRSPRGLSVHERGAVPRTVLIARVDVALACRALHRECDALHSSGRRRRSRRSATHRRRTAE